MLLWILILLFTYIKVVKRNYYFPVEGVIPFAFYELLFLKYIKTDMTPEEMLYEFEEVNANSMEKHPMNFRNRMLKTVRRFSKRFGEERDRKWLSEFCCNNGIDDRLGIQLRS